ncbi:LacI family DNA-binding transcriptional regulator [Vibrio spartinae]|uniref:Catabolite control protein A n=1 Tax=Vibrio spartinae TaxID=1918945 RepID=A0A1N6M3I4_9VIBR|nr:substrate-binding domain-containing protein [Vibrio spartinae]QMV14516.1 Glucose-resistance amylase regulator [Vibrio spartinae]SIO94004.1 Catabolite control protein A [Vibrio spartinae]
MSILKQKGAASAAEVARLAGVSRSAVSRTFTPGASVSKDTRQRVLEAAKALNYHVNHLARGLSNERSRPVCLLGANLNAPYQARLLDTLTQRLQQAGRAVMVINTSGLEADADAALRQTLNYRASATIVLSGTPQASLVETCVNSGQHVILVNRAGQFEGADHISLDYSSSMFDALYMLKQAGCRRLAVVSSTIQSPSLLGRENIFLEAAQEAKIKCHVYHCGSTSYQTGVDTARQILVSRNRPDGVFCVTDLIACGFMDAARQEFNLNIPDDICVIGFDNIEQAGWLSYQLTTFGQPLEDMTNAIIERLENTDASKQSGEALLFQAPLIWRQTVRSQNNLNKSPVEGE